MFTYKNLIFSLRGELAFFIKLYEAVLSLYYRSDILVIALILFNNYVRPFYSTAFIVSLPPIYIISKIYFSACRNAKKFIYS